MTQFCHTIVDRPGVRIDHFRSAGCSQALVFVFGEQNAGPDAIEQFLLQKGFDVLSIRGEHDYLTDRDLAEIDRWLTWTTQPYRGRLGFGSGAGGYAALRLAKRLRFDRLLLLSPEIGASSEVAVARLAGIEDMLVPTCHYLIALDPYSASGEWIWRFRSLMTRATSSWLPLPYAGHPALSHLMAVKILGPLIFAALNEGRLLPFGAIRRAHRAQSMPHLHRLAEHALRRNHLVWAESINGRASAAAEHPRNYIQAAEILDRQGRFPEALAALDRARNWKDFVASETDPQVAEIRARAGLAPAVSPGPAAVEMGEIRSHQLPADGEAVRLVVWDLDETFWKGTLTEGGITEYVQAHHDLVIELARRGIMSSICSKNDRETVLTILRERGIADYFIFPSIDWNPKGARLAALIEAVQLRPATVMFIDDNPGNRAEAMRVVPDLQVEDEHFPSRLLNDPRFKGKDDTQLTRLGQYKLLEKRKRDEHFLSGNNADFLRSCDIKVRIEYDVMAHANRAIELINRTNQLNFTKMRLPEDPDEALRVLAESVNNRWRQSGLVHVVDKYGDYGFVGFFMLENGAQHASGQLKQTLNHYCFSCRTLGMQIERWLYGRLQRPRIKVVGEVLTDLDAPGEIDWIRMASSLEDENALLEKAAPEIRIHGGCEAASIAHYLGAHSEKVVTTGNFFGGSHFIRVNSASLMLSACDRHGEAFRKEAESLRIPYEMLTNDYFKGVPEGTLFVFGGQFDSPGPFRYRHKVHGWEFRIEPPRPQVLGVQTPDMTKVTPEEFDTYLGQLKLLPKVVEDITAISWHISRHYESVPSPSHEQITVDVRRLLDRVPAGSKIVFMTDHDHVRYSPELFRLAQGIRTYNQLMAEIVAPYPFAAIASFSDAIIDDSEILIGGNHYDRMVYCRMAERIIAVAAKLEPK